MKSWKKPNVANYNIVQKAYAGFSTRSKLTINAHCKKHPKHRQSPGVCSICLTEKLSQLMSINPINGSSSRAKPAARSSPSSSSSSYLSSLSSSSCSSTPVVIYELDMDSGRCRMIRNSMRVILGQNINVLKKSRSMAFVLPPRRKDDDDHHDENGNGNGKKKIVGIKGGGFWSKLLPTSGRLMTHWRTMRERTVFYGVHQGA